MKILESEICQKEVTYRKIRHVYKNYICKSLIPNMARSTSLISAADEVIMNKIYVIRGQKVMIDRDLI